MFGTGHPVRRQRGLTLVELLTVVVLSAIVFLPFGIMAVVVVKTTRENATRLQLAHDSATAMSTVYIRLLPVADYNIVNPIVIRVAWPTGDPVADDDGNGLDEHMIYYDGAADALMIADTNGSYVPIPGSIRPLVRNVTDFSIEVGSYATLLNYTMKLGNPSPNGTYEFEMEVHGQVYLANKFG